MTITHDHDSDREELERLIYTKMQLVSALKMLEEAIKQKQWEQSKKS